ncbi:MAG: tRNA epoxyqueuosine(34) reductase QueG [Planctomycetes bacterium GWF2_42_9]|nr:MAG: tRNA epoxyqueuosine(34) reductase QueG [Planctomycetes bacterium GWF2_42_9]HAL44549.1 tRNA epoxyqueuosine(34) reductase QueG [Phycisphaerales bacterium]
MSVEENIKQKALSLGFDLVGITSAQDIDSTQKDQFNNWLQNGCNGQMEFLARNIDNRFKPSTVLPDAKSVICAAINYKIKPITEKNYLQIASYALYPDYHTFIKDKLSALADFLKSIDKDVKYKICVDSSAIAEKAIAMRAGIGFIGKNRLITNQKFGSFLLLGEIVTSFKLEPDAPIEKQDCGKCKKCIEACPTGALCENGFDARKCISYLTIEHKSEIAKELQSKIGKRLFGCEECLKACPYNEKSPICEKKQIGFEAKNVKLTAEEVLGWTEKEFNAFAQNSVIHRTGLERIKRNALICRELREPQQLP